MSGRHSHEIEIKAEFYECDPMDVVWHGRYVEYFERVRSALFAGLGFGWAEMRASGCYWPVVDLWVRYNRPVRPGQRLIARAELLEWQNRLLTRYEIRDAESGERLTKGETIQVAVLQSDGSLLLELPADVRQKLEAS